MFKRVIFLVVFVFVMVAAAGPDVAVAGVDPLASPTPRPTERITAPVISGVNPDAVLSEGNQRDGLPSDSFDPAGILLPNLVDFPLYVDLKSLSASPIPSYADISRNFDGTNLRHLEYFDEFLEDWYADIED